MAANLVEPRIYDSVHKGLKVAGFSDDKAQNYALFALDAYKVIADDPQLQGALKALWALKDAAKNDREMIQNTSKAMAATLYADRGLALNLKTAENFVVRAGQYTAKGQVSAAGIVTAFVQYFAGLAQTRGIVLNECAMSVTELVLNAISAVLLAATEVGIIEAGFQSLAAAQSLYSVADKCLDIH